jgi:hypothetical protein
MRIFTASSQLVISLSPKFAHQFWDGQVGCASEVKKEGNVANRVLPVRSTDQNNVCMVERKKNGKGR